MDDSDGSDKADMAHFLKVSKSETVIISSPKLLIVKRERS